ncbi:MAG: ABC transporter permease, partial [Mediterranea sp.]|nr:ABC transporter permease [Mediterranea sp.]
MIRFLLEKEFKQLFRNPFLPKLIFILPVTILLVLPWALNQEVKNVRIDIVDSDHSTTSRLLREKVVASHYFHLNAMPGSGEAALVDIERGDADVLLEILPHFEKQLTRKENAQVLISSNAVNGTKGALAASYLASIVQAFAHEQNPRLPSAGTSMPTLSTLNLFNPRLDNKVFMIPALMVMLLT